MMRGSYERKTYVLCITCIIHVTDDMKSDDGQVKSYEYRIDQDPINEKAVRVQKN